MANISRATLQTIAAKLGVSLTTVHASLSRRGRVSEATRKKVCEFAEELGYTPNVLARALRTKHTGNIALVVPTVGAPLVGSILSGVEMYATNQGYNILLACAVGKAEREHELIDTFLGLGVEGLLLYPDHYRYSREFIDRISQQIPIVLLENSIPDIDLDMVGVDHFAMGMTAGELLKAHGRLHQGYLLPFAANRSQWSTLRSSGQRRVAESGDDVTFDLLGEPVTEKISMSAYAMKALRTHFASGKPLDGLFVANDEFAYAAIAALQTLGYRVPEDIAVIGCDDHVGSDIFTVPLTTFQQPMEDLGLKAAGLLFHRMGETTQQTPERLLLPATLIQRDSCGAHLATCPDHFSMDNHR